MLRKSVALIVVLFIGPLVVVDAAGEEASEKNVTTAKARPARCYRLISGKNDEMCRLFERNLNRFCDEPPMVCERKIHPDFAKYFSFPDWEEVDPGAHLDLIADYVRAQAPKYALCAENDEGCQREWREKKWKEYEPDLLARMKAGQVKLSRAIMNIFAERRLVYRLFDYPCSPSSEMSWRHPQVPKLFAVNQETGLFDKEFATIHRFSRFDPIFYKGGKEAYIVEWEGGHSVFVSGRLRVSFVPHTMCLFEYKSNAGKGH